MARRKSKEEWKVHENVFDQFTLRIVFKLEGQGHFTHLESAYKLGKEANVFTARTKDDDLIVVKIYRLHTCNFNKMYEYLVQDERFINFKGHKRKVVLSWVQREYRNLLKAREVIRVPTPIAVKDNVLVLEMIGDDEPAQQLKDLTPEDPEAFLDAILLDMKKLKDHGLVHGDLSAFNILNYNDVPVFIDFSQATTTKSPGWKELLERDVKNVLMHFKKIGVERDYDATLQYLLGRNE